MDFIFESGIEDNLIAHRHVFQDTLANGQNNSNKRGGTVELIEKLVLRLVRDLSEGRSLQLNVANTSKWENLELTSNKKLTVKGKCPVRLVDLGRPTSQHRFVLIIYVLKEVHRLLMTNTYCTIRELYYRDPQLVINQRHIDNASRDLSNILNKMPSDLGLLKAGKGLVAGPLQIMLTNGDIIDYGSSGAGQIPKDMTSVEALSSSASFVLVVEKETIFEQLIAGNIFMKSNVLLVTGKGYPDTCTLMLVERLHRECRLPIYGIFDCDPFGIEIMLIYRHGSKAGAMHNIACPHIKWLGVHPTEIRCLPGMQCLPFSPSDGRKLKTLLSRNYIGENVRKELQLLAGLQLKAEIEGLKGISEEFLMNDYIVNKIQRNLYL